MKGKHRMGGVIHAVHGCVLHASVRRWAVVLFLLNLLVALAFTFLVFPEMLDATSGLDADGYGRTGRVLYETGRFDSLTQAPLYPGFIAGISWAHGGYAVRYIQAAQALLAALTCVVMYSLFREVLDSGIAKYAGLACAVYPMTIWYVPRLWTETLLTFMLAVFSLSLVRVLRRPTSVKMCLCGLAAGALALSKGIGVVFVFFVPFLLLARFRREGLRWIVLFLLSAAFLIAPWTYRNLQITGRFIPIHATSGYNFYLGNGFTRHWLESPLSYVDLKVMTLADMQTLSDAQGSLPEDPVDLDDALMRAALAEFVADPLLPPQKILTQSLTFWFLAATPSKSIVTGLVQAPVVILAVVGVIRARRRRSWALALLIPVLGIMSIAVVVYAFARLSSTIMPYMLGLAVYSLPSVGTSSLAREPDGLAGSRPS